MNISLSLEALWKIIGDLYNTSTVPVRFAYIYWIVFAVLYLFLGGYEKRHQRIPKRKIKRQNYPGTLYVFGIIAFLFHHGSLNWELGFYSEMTSANFFALFVCGFVFMSAGILLVIRGRMDLNGLWGIQIFKYEENVPLVKEGIFNTCRHPIYAGQIAMTIGTVCLANNWWVSILPLGTTILCIWRAKREEQDLFDRFGEVFIEYKDATSFIIPWIGQKKENG